MRESIIRNALATDLTDVAEIHKNQFSDHYLGQFSIELLRLFYSGFLNRDIIFLVSEVDGRVCGFVVGGNLKSINRCSSIFIKDNISLYTREIFLRPHTWVKSLKKLFNLLFRKNVPAESLDYIMEYTLLSISVCPSFQGKGIAGQLVTAFDSNMKEYSDEYFLSVKDTNARAISFYEKNGFVKERHFSGEVQLIKKIG